MRSHDVPFRIEPKQRRGNGSHVNNERGSHLCSICDRDLHSARHVVEWCQYVDLIVDTDFTGHFTTVEVHIGELVVDFDADTTKLRRHQPRREFGGRTPIHV